MPTFLCTNSAIPGQTYQCSEAEACAYGIENVRLSDDAPNNMIKEFQLYCPERSHYRQLIGTFYFLGGCIGTTILSYLSDIWGRKRVLIICNVIASISFLLMSFSSSLYLIYILSAIASGGVLSYYSISVVHMTESAGR